MQCLMYQYSLQLCEHFSKEISWILMKLLILLQLKSFIRQHLKEENASSTLGTSSLNLRQHMQPISTPQPQNEINSQQNWE